MTEYIITEENLQEVFEHADWGMTNFQKFKDKLHPYNPQAEREKVLHNIQHVIAEHCGDGIHKGWVLAHPLDIWIAKELREGKDGERG
jgi:hypothetical protein